MQMLRVMKDFWYQTFGAQDTLAVCLEVQQRVLFDDLRRKLLNEIRFMGAQMKIPGMNRDAFNQFTEVKRLVLRGIRYVN